MDLFNRNFLLFKKGLVNNMNLRNNHLGDISDRDILVQTDARNVCFFYFVRRIFTLRGSQHG